MKPVKCETCGKLPFIKRETMRSCGFSVTKFYTECDCGKLISSGQRQEIIHKWNDLQRDKANAGNAVLHLIYGQKGNEMYKTFEIEISDFSLGCSRTIDGILREYRDKCTCDEDFTERMKVYQRDVKPEIWQYVFDDRPIYYTILKPIEKEMTFFVYRGEYHE